MVNRCVEEDEEVMVDDSDGAGGEEEMDMGVEEAVHEEVPR